jgi:hypothetical protein
MNTETHPAQAAAAETFPQLHVYAQTTWHDDAFVVGNRQGLEALRAAIDAALSGGAGQAQPFVNDGEGFDAHVLLASEEDMAKLAVPYTGDDARDQPGARWPWRLLQERGAR